MARHPRLKIPGHAAAYHIVTRTRGTQYLLDRTQKERFIQLLEKLKKLYYVQYAAYSILDNHYHLLVNFKDPEDIDPTEAEKRWNTYHEKTPFKRRADIEKDAEYVKDQMTDISSYMKRLNYHMTTGYNLPRNAQGTLWERRYQSSIVERGPAMVMTAAYIDLNAYRASLVTRPEDYRYSSLYELRHKNKAEKIPDPIDTTLLEEGLHTGLTSIEELYSTYRAYIYRAGASPHKDRPDGLVITQDMQKQLEAYGLHRIEEGSLSRRITELIRGKVTAGMMYARDFYYSRISPGLSGDAGRRHEEGWVRQLRGGIWNVCSVAAAG